MRSERGKAKLDAKKFAIYSAAGAASLAGVGESAEAAITYQLVNQLVADTVPDTSGVAVPLYFDTPGQRFRLDFAHALAQNNAALGSAVIGRLVNQTLPAPSFAGVRAGNPTLYSYVTNIQSGAQISEQAFLPVMDPAPALMAYRAGYPNSRFLQPGEGFLGVRFNANQYGWIRVNMNGSPLNSFTIVDYAYADSGETIFAGQTTAIPEPGSLACLALGAVAVSSWRRQRESQAV